MLTTEIFGERLHELGFDFFSGVPCSFLTPLINYASMHCQYVAAVNEGDAVATCAGAYLGGRKSVFLCQNSGLTNACSPLTSLIHTYQIPILGFVTLRGDPELNDEPQHQLMGEITTLLLDQMKLQWAYLSDDVNEAQQQLVVANSCIEAGKAFIFVVRKNTFSKVTLDKQAEKALQPHGVCWQDQPGVDVRPKRHQVLERLSELRQKDTLMLTATGYTSRELCQLNDYPGNFYMVGSMGCLAPLSLGLVLSQSKPVIAIDGDGAVLMRAGALAANGCYAANHLFHLVLDNQTYESTGNQACVSVDVNFPMLAAAMGYQQSIKLHGLEELEQAIQIWYASPKPTFACLRIDSGSLSELRRPELSPSQVADRFKAFIHG